MLSRRRVARFIAKEIVDGNKRQAINMLAGYILFNKLQRQTSLFLKDIDTFLEKEGLLKVKLSSSRKLDDKEKENIISMIGSMQPRVDKVFIEEHIDESLIGGIKVDLPSSYMDTTVKNSLKKMSMILNEENQ